PSIYTLSLHDALPISLSSSVGASFLGAASGSRISTFGTSPLRVIVLRVPSASVIVTMKSSLRMSVPSNFCPLARVTVTGMGFDPPPPRLPRPPPPPPDTHVFCSVRGSLYFDAIPLRSPVTEWQLAHFELK